MLHDQVLASGGLHIVGNVTSLVVSTTSCVAVLAVKVMQGPRALSLLDDQLLRIFAGERLRTIMDKLKMPEGEAIEHPMVKLGSLSQRVS